LGKGIGEIMIKPVDDTIVYLEQLGLTHEAKSTSLLSEHPATAYTISVKSPTPVYGWHAPDGKVRRMSEYES
jgi:hypothetical protein